MTGEEAADDFQRMLRVKNSFLDIFGPIATITIAVGLTFIGMGIGPRLRVRMAIKFYQQSIANLNEEFRIFWPTSGCSIAYLASAE